MSTLPTSTEAEPETKTSSVVTESLPVAEVSTILSETSETSETSGDAAETFPSCRPTDRDVDLVLKALPDDDDDAEIPSYWETGQIPSSMLSPRSVAALARLRSFVPPPFPLWNTLPASRRAAVLILLFADRVGELRVVLTMRSANLRSFSGHAAFPGGKADTLQESEFQIARREAWEEIGLPLSDDRLPEGFRIEELCVLPFNLAKTELVVRPCVAFLHAPEHPPPGKGGGGRSVDAGENGNGERTLLPRLDAKEVAAVFSAPFHNFLLAEDEVPERKTRETMALPRGKWYEGSWTYWHEDSWRMHFFYVPVTNQRVTKPSPEGTSIVSQKPDPLTNDSSPAPERPALPNGSADADPEDESRKADVLHVAESAAHKGRYKVWGMTARMLVDAAMIAYGEEPEFEHNAHFGDEKIIMGLERLGRLGEKKRPGGVLTGDDLRRAKMEAEGRGTGKGRI